MRSGSERRAGFGLRVHPVDRGGNAQPQSIEITGVQPREILGDPSEHAQSSSVAITFTESDNPTRALHFDDRAQRVRFVYATGVQERRVAVRREVPFSAYLFFKYAAHVDTPYPPDTWGEALHEEQIVEQARRMVDTYGFGSIKLKAGVFPPEHETSCIKALRRAFPSHPLRIDPNASWSIETAVRVADMIGRDIEYYEDPTAGLEGMAELRRRTGMALATNMVVTDLDEFRRNVALGAVQIILADHHYWGGLRDTQILARMCATFGLGVSMHSNSHLGISLMAMAHVAAAVPNLSYACDTHYPWQDEEVVVGGKVPMVAGCVRISDSPGLGVDLDRERLRALHEQFLAIDIRSRDDARQMRKYDPNWRALQPRF
jgi:glucarate dehydratase